jgi:uncharacterized protein (DUF58 family)
MTDRGRFALAAGAAIYLIGWLFGSLPLYPVAVGLVLAVGAAAVWTRLVGKPARLRRSVRGGDHVAGDDIPVELELELDGRFTPGSLSVVDQIERLGEREVVLRRRAGRLRGQYLLQHVPRGRYPIEATRVLIEDPFALVSTESDAAAPGALLVYPKLVRLDRLFSETGSRAQEGRRLLLRRPSGFDLHSVREYQQGESLRRVHWPSTAKRRQLMVKDLEDSPRDEVLVVLDADAAFAVGTPPDSSFEVAVSAAGSILQAHVGRGRRAGLIVNAIEPRYQPVHSLDGDWDLALELLASVEPNGRNAVTAMLVEGAGMPSKALELCVVTCGLTPRLADRLLQRSVTRRGTSLVYVDPTSFANGAPLSALPPADVRAQIGRLDLAGIPVCVVRRGADLAALLGAAEGAALPVAAEVVSAG